MKIDWHGNKGFRELRTSAGARQLCEDKAQQVKSAAEVGAHRSEYGLTAWNGTNRAGANVYTKNPAAMVREAKWGTLLRAMGGA